MTTEHVKKRITVVGAVIVDGGNVFAARRSEHMSLPGMWEFPGGKVEAGETPQDALRRELMEELRCHVEVGQLVESTEYEYDFGVVHLTTFLCTMNGDAPHLTEHSEIRWVPTAQLDDLEWAPADVPAVESVMKLLQ
ncbi:(deoxy)nucleoside triphosphate pyrophosphohydrolase [Changpingibacter yushuensis]|uniref:(deoxy)nucleoside triphosphate pyrophosphohydrolase n=1 Tax=Changpingibacter yushuensis TaxID=2758440 RepID=UPI0015F5E9F1|nr:(deoxy)nucleoside triphosphate pyrophosphohydrolase [Changpingibacter yushuensis]